MLRNLILTDSDELGYYTTFEKLFPKFKSFYQNTQKSNKIEINFSLTDEDTPPTKAQLNAHEFLLTHSNEMLESILQYLKQDEEYFMEFFGVYREVKHESYSSKEGFPILNNAKDFINYFEIETINISDSKEDECSYIGFAGSCTWQGEHGFGVAFNKSKLLHVGGWDYGHHPNWASSTDPKDHFLTKNFTHFHRLEALDKRKSRLTQLSQSIHIETIEGYQEIFDWLIKHKMIYGYRNSPLDLTLTEKIVLLHEIKELRFYGNEIISIPESINLLENLMSLSFVYNKLEDFPLQITKLTRLKKLSISSNSVKYIPSEIKLLKNLESLSLDNNRLQSIPEEIRELTNVKDLDLSDNIFTSLPDVFSSIQSLKKLDLSGNQLTHIPQSISQVKTLEELDLTFNEIITLPESIFSDMPNLKWLEIAGNHISLKDLRLIQKLIPPEIETDIDTAIDYEIDDQEGEEEND